MKFKSQEIAVLTIFSSIAVSTGYVGGIAVMISGIPATSTFMALVAFTIFVTGYLIVRRFGAMTMMLSIYGIFQVPSTEFGPPGLYKIPITFVMGLIFDTIVFLWRSPESSIPLAAGVASFFAPVQVLFYGSLLNITGIDGLYHIIWIMASSAFFFGFVGGRFGLYLGKRLNIGLLPARRDTNEP